MREEIKFSVVIPVYNAEATIKRTLDSCIAQTHTPYEIIVVDDFSTDETANIIATYGNDVKYIQLLQNNGASVARNKGLDAATGDYIAFLDADDVWHSKKLEIMGAILASVNIDIALIYHPFTLQDINSIELPESGTLYRLPFVKLLQRNPIATPCAIMRNNTKYRFEASMRYMEDYDMWLRIAHKNPVYFIKIPLTQINRPVLSTGGLSANKWKMRKGELRSFRRLARLNPLYIFLLPILYPYSIAKHIFKASRGY
jgi:teichuronic acid biosynthesis glycosyltransferase TuaG